jgi:hypothetical protein
MIIEIICFLFIVLFVYTASSKLLDYEKFRIELGKSPLLTLYAGWVAWLVPIGELLLAVMLTIPRFRTIALYGSFSLMVMFTTYLIVILNFSYYIPCTCGGVIQNMSWNTHIVFNIAFIILSIIAIVLTSKKSSGRSEIAIA